MCRSTRIHIFLYPLLALLALAGCALSPQTVSISPVLVASGTTQPAGKRLAVRVRDTRSNKIIGYRGGVYKTASITTTPDLTQSVYKKVAQYLRQTGFQISTGNATPATSLEIDIRDLSYQARQKNILWHIKVFASINAIVTADGRQKTLQLDDSVTREFAHPPSPRQNEILINDVFSKLLQRLLDNRKFLQS